MVSITKIRLLLLLLLFVLLVLLLSLLLCLLLLLVLGGLLLFGNFAHGGEHPHEADDTVLLAHQITSEDNYYYKHR